MARMPIDCDANDCPVRTIIDLVGDKWTSRVLSHLADGSLRFGELRRLVVGVSRRMLTETLRDLERNGLVCRTVHPTIPPGVEYALTPLGDSLVPQVQALVRWSKENGAARSPVPPTQRLFLQDGPLVRHGLLETTANSH